MPSLNELRRKIKSIKSTQQITKAMKMIAGARLSRAQKERADALYCADTVGHLLVRSIGPYQAGYVDDVTKRLYAHPFIAPVASGKTCLVVVTGDKGLCAGFNGNILRAANEFIAGHKDRQITLFVIGKKGHDYFFRRRLSPLSEYINVMAKLDFAQSESIARELFWHYCDDGISELVFIYNEFKSIIRQKVTVRKVLPLDPQEMQGAQDAPDYLYEPHKASVCRELFTRYLACRLHGILRDSYAAELGARMTAMDQATKNAHELIDTLTLEMNKVRQAGITRELADIVGTSEVLR